MTLLDDWMPGYDAISRHEIVVNATTAQVYDVARTMDLGGSAVVKVLMGVRAAPAAIGSILRGRLDGARQSYGSRHVRGLGFTLLAEEPGREFVLGLMGRFWTPTGGLVPATVADFRTMPPPGLAQGMWNFRVEPIGARCRLTTETRVRCGDESSRRGFARYWRIVRFGSALTRRSMLRQIRRRAERATRVRGAGT